MSFPLLKEFCLRRASFQRSPRTRRRLAGLYLFVLACLSVLACDSHTIATNYKKNLRNVATSYEQLEVKLPPAGKPHTPSFVVKDARFHRLVTSNLGLSPAQNQRLESTGFIAVSSADPGSMGDAYRDIWQADLPLLITTDSILHAWHRSYDVTLERLELGEFADAYLALIVNMRAKLPRTLEELPAELLPELKKVDAYLSVALSLLQHMSRDGRVIEDDGDWQTAKPAVVAPILATVSEVQQIIDAIYAQSVASVPYFGEVDFTQFKVRGHYTAGQGLAQYFRAVMWMGRADSGFLLVSPSGEINLSGVQSAALLALLASQADSLPRYVKTQAAIDYFVGRSNGLSLPAVVSIVEAERVSLPDLSDTKQVQELAQLFISAAEPTTISSQAVLSRGADTPPALVFQISSQRFVLDSYVHDQTSFDSVDERYMVNALDVPAALGSGTATRLLKQELESYRMVRQFGSLQKTIADLPADYWTQNIYTRWLGALRSLNAAPKGSTTPGLFLSEAWERKMLQTQLASWAELRRDTILYAAQAFGTIGCDFPDVYVEPFPEFYDHMHDMAKNAADRLPNPQFFERFAQIMGRLAAISRVQLSGQSPSEEQMLFLKSLVKRQVVGGDYGSEVHWTGWYRELFADDDAFKYQPVIADVYTDPNSGRVLNVATTPVQLALVALETHSGPTLFVGPISGFRQFAGQRMTDQEWQERIEQNQLPPPPVWTASFQAGSVRKPQPHP